MSKKTNSTKKPMHANARRRLIERIRKTGWSPGRKLAFLELARSTSYPDALAALELVQEWPVYHAA